MNIFFFLIGIVLFLTILFLGIFLLSLFTGGPYVRTRKSVRKNIFLFADLKSGDTVLDLGSGDAVILRELAKNGICGIGWELNPFLVMFSKVVIFFHRESRYSVRVEWKNFWTHPLPKVDAVILYTLPATLEKIQDKLQKELSPHTKIISVDFHFPNLHLLKSENRLLLYTL